MRITPTSALPVETGEMALEMQRLQLVLIYEANLEGQPSSTSIIRILPREGKMGVKELWLDDRRQGEFGLFDKNPTVSYSAILCHQIIGLGGYKNGYKPVKKRERGREGKR